MKTIAIRSNAEQILNENFKNSGLSTLREYVETSAENDPNFFRFLFNEDFDNDFSASLTEDHKQLYNSFIESI